MDLSMRNLRSIFQCKIDDDLMEEKRMEFLFFFSDGEEDEDDEGISERSLRRTPSDDGKYRMCVYSSLM